MKTLRLLRLALIIIICSISAAQVDASTYISHDAVLECNTELQPNTLTEYTPSFKQDTEFLLPRHLLFGKCRIRVNGEHNGVAYDMVVTISDISFISCLILKLGDLFTKKY